MYPLIVALLMVVLPVLSVVLESARGAGTLLELVGKWFLFWAVGVRLSTAALRQIVQPEFTARDIFGVTDRAAWIVVQELGFANLATGVAALCSLFIEAWRPPIALVSGLFYGLAGLRHVLNRPRDLNENIALYSDLWVCLVLAVYLIAHLLG